MSSSAAASPTTSRFTVKYQILISLIPLDNPSTSLQIIVFRHRDMKILSTIVCSLYFSFPQCNCFSPNKIAPPRPLFIQRQTSSDKGNDGSHSDLKLTRYSEDEAIYTMEKARECVHSELCSVEDANTYLREAIHVS